MKKDKDKNNDLEVNVLMLGGRRCGKTSLLTTMYNSFDTTFGSTDLTITATDNDTLNILIEKNKDILKLLETKSHSFEADEKDNAGPNTGSDNYYKFTIGIKGKSRGKIKLKFIDYPGEWLGNKEHESFFTEKIQQADVILITIDTPFLMQKSGKNNEYKNHSYQIAELLKTHLEDGLNGDNVSKMILFVPIKCERYYYTENNMYNLKERIKAVYGNLISHINNEAYRNKCEMAITPVLTLGTIEFSRFKRGLDAEPETHDTYGTFIPLYVFRDGVPHEQQPLYCEQPLIYILLYLIKRAEVARNKKKESRFWILKMLKSAVVSIEEKFFEMPSADDFVQQSDKLKSKLESQMYGYEIITDPLKLKQK